MVFHQHSCTLSVWGLEIARAGRPVLGTHEVSAHVF
jgi:hypothetical protein